MKVIYSKKISEKLNEVIRESDIIGRDIEKILLTKREMYQLAYELKGTNLLPEELVHRYRGITIEEEKP